MFKTLILEILINWLGKPTIYVPGRHMGGNIYEQDNTYRVDCKIISGELYFIVTTPKKETIKTNG